MTNLVATPGWSGVYQLEQEPAIGGPGGVMNAQAQALLNRTEALKNTEPVNSTATTYALSISDQLKYLRLANAGTITVTVPNNSTAAIDIGVSIPIRQVGAGQVVIAGAGGVTINTAETLKTRKQGSSIMLIKVGTNEWDLTGDLELLP